MKKILFACFAVLSLTACGTTKPSTFYVLDSNALPVESKTLKNADNIKIGIEPVFVPNYLNRPQIVIRDDDGVTLKMSEFNRWAEQIFDVFPRVLATSISETMKYPAAKQINLNRDLFPYRLFVEVLRFDAAFGKEAVLDAWWTVMTRDGKMIRRVRTTLTEPAGDTFAAVVASEQKLIARLGAVIGAYAKKNLK